jgi:HlyD family secretion protein
MTSVALFRAEAEKLVQRPEQLATGLRLVGSGYAAAISALCVLVVAVVVGAVFIQVPISVAGTGVILSSKGVLEITVSSDYEGRITDVLVDVGDRVEPGQEIARLVQPALRNDLKLAESELDLINQEEARVRALQLRITELIDKVSVQQEENILASMQPLQDRINLLEQLARGNETLRQNGQVTADRYLKVQADLDEAQERLASKRSSLLTITLDHNERQAQYERELQALATRHAQAQRQIDRLRERIRNETVVRSTTSGIVSELKVFPGDLVRFDTPLISLLPVDESFATLRPGEAHLIAAVLIPTKDGKKIRAGMDVLIDPTSVRRDVFGSIRGKVVSTSNVAASPEQMRQILRNDDLVRKLTAAGPPFLIRVEMERDPHTKSGLRWTSSLGADTQITAGTLLEAKVLTERVSLLGLLMPAVKELLRGPRREDREI